MVQAFTGIAMMLILFPTGIFDGIQITPENKEVIQYRVFINLNGNIYTEWINLDTGWTDYQGTIKIKGCQYTETYLQLPTLKISQPYIWQRRPDGSYISKNWILRKR